MADEERIQTLAEVVEEIVTAGDGADDVTVQDVLRAVGPRSFGPLLLAPGLILMSPISGIPGLPTAGAVLIIVIAGQLLVGRHHFWIPQFLLRRSIRRERLQRTEKFLMLVARFVDRFVRPRVLWLIHRPAQYLIAASCVLVALMMPPLEAIPFANTLTATAVSAFGLALVAHDGVLVIFGFALTLGSVYFLWTRLPI